MIGYRKFAAFVIAVAIICFLPWWMKVVNVSDKIVVVQLNEILYLFIGFATANGVLSLSAKTPEGFKKIIEKITTLGIKASDE